MQTTKASPKKRKQAHVDDGATNRSNKRPRKEDKANNNLKEKLHEFRVVSTSLTVSIPPTFATKPREGVQEMLDSMLMRYIPALQGVMLSHSNMTFLNSAATIKGDCPFANTTATFDATVWSPRIGMKLPGTLNLCSPDHISLLVHRTFNVSIPRHHIPEDNWEFEYGPAENDPEFALEPTTDAGEEAEDPYKGGRWTHKVTGEVLGGDQEPVEFVVIGYAVANQMLSLVGSLQHDPFSPEHVPRTTVVGDSRGRFSEHDDDAAPSRMEDNEWKDDLNSDSDVEDPFSQLGKLKDDAAAAAARGPKEKMKARPSEPEATRNGAKKKRKEKTKVKKV